MILLLFIAVLAHLSPEPIAVVLGHSTLAWETVMYGIEATALWLFAAWHLKAKAGFVLTGALCGWGVFESVQRPLCRLAFPMNERLVLAPGEFLCDKAGWQTSELSAIAALFVLSVIYGSKPWTSSQA